ncbi:MAG: WD40 repeat domain-containing protein, partial [Candidatus Xenobia bacterium]
VALSPDGHYLLSCSKDTTMRLWDVSTGGCLLVRDCHGESVAVTPDMRIVAFGSTGGLIKVLDLGSDTMQVLRGHEGAVQALALSPDGQWLLSGADDRTVRVWPLSNPQKVKVLKGHGKAVLSAAISEDGRIGLTGARDGSMFLWDVAGARQISSLVGHSEWVSGVGLSANAHSAISVSHDGSMRSWTLDWDLAEWVQVDEAAIEEHIRRYLACHTQLVAHNGGVVRQGQPAFIEEDLSSLLDLLGACGLGGLSRDVLHGWMFRLLAG